MSAGGEPMSPALLDQLRVGPPRTAAISARNRVESDGFDVHAP